MPSYNPAIIEKYAADLYARGSSIIWRWGCIGMGCGFLFAAFALKSFDELPQEYRLGTLAVCVIVGLFVGRSIGTDRAFHLFLQAQTALCQVQIEKNTRRHSS